MIGIYTRIFSFSMSIRSRDCSYISCDTFDVTGFGLLLLTVRLVGIASWLPFGPEIVTLEFFGL